MAKVPLLAQVGPLTQEPGAHARVVQVQCGGSHTLVLMQSGPRLIAAAAGAHSLPVLTQVTDMSGDGCVPLSLEGRTETPRASEAFEGCAGFHQPQDGPDSLFMRGVGD
jgi:hypothetical protein